MKSQRARFGCVAMALTMASTVEAASLRPRFEPTDLELLSPGTLGLDHQSGFTVGNRTSARRWIVSDLELNLGLSSNVEFDVDWAFINDSSGPSGRWQSDPLWPSVKLGLFDWHLPGTHHAIAGGVQLGPRLPVWNSGKGVGYAALGLLGWTWGTSQTVVNAGYALDPGATVSTGRPSAFVIGLDWNQPLDRQQRFSLLTELATVLYTSADPNERDASLGLAWDPTDRLELSAVVIGGQLAGGDHWSVLLGVSPTMKLW